MSGLPNPTPAPTHEVKVRVNDATLLGFFEHREALGFHSENAVMALCLTALGPVPPDKLFEVLAKVRGYHRSTKAKGVTNK